MSLCIVTCGPASTRIDEVRRLTNFSTGELGTLLAEALLAAGHEVICLRGEGATFRAPMGVALESFFSNDALLALLQKIRGRQSVHHLFHAAALTDFAVTALTDEHGRLLPEKKISSTTPVVNLRLEPAPKVIAQLRPLFPQTQITGWKYELSGTSEDALQKARLQVKDCQTDACVLNGAAYGPGYAYLTSTSRHDFTDKPGLVQFLAQTAGGL